MSAVLLAAAGILIMRWQAPSSPAVSEQRAEAAARFVDERQCVDCHAAEHQAWSGSHHALAMQEATDATVLGDFADASFTRHGVRTRFLRRDGRFFVNTDGPGGKAADFEVKYTFGVDPLQQYLLELPRGRLQALTIAWDTHRKRWFDLYPDERIDSADELHWTQPSNNWNFMCAECHSTDVRRNYDAGQDTYRTTFAQINVGCQACHGPASAHLAQVTEPQRARTGTPAGDSHFAAALGDRHSQLETCALCHSRRAAVAPGYRHGRPLMDSHLPSLLEPGLYFADGQIDGEVFEYGSFLQSRMHMKGVRCSDCHEPHSLDLRAPGNAVCTACHNDTGPVLRHAVDVSGLKRKNYDSSAHHFHGSSGPGTQCVDCHMPARTYMVVDDRRDHSLRVPRPDLSVKLGTPNACNLCHDDRTPEWAAQAIEQRHGPERIHGYGYEEALWAGRHRHPGALRGLARVVQDEAQPPIVRATALHLLRSYPTSESFTLLRGALSDPDPLVRRAALDGLEALPPARRVAPVAPLLEDPVRTVRMEAARLLAGAPRSGMRPRETAALAAALEEYAASQLGNADRAESHLNLGALYLSTGQAERAEAAYRAALRLDARFAPAYVNLADVKAGQGLLQEAESILRAGLDSVSEQAPLHHALGLVLVRQKRPEHALAELRRAMELAPTEPRYAYVHGVAVHDLHDPAAGLEQLRAALNRFPNDRDLLLALASYARNAGDETQARVFLERLRLIEE